MRRVPYKAYGLIAITLFLLLSLPIERSEQLRVNLMATIAPVSSRLQGVTGIVTAPMKMWHAWGRVEELEREIERIRLENSLIQEAWEQLDPLLARIPPVQSLLARVVFRAPTTWNSSLWIDVGSQTNHQVVQKNSPVVIGDSLIGIVDYVGSHQSRVRLISDSGLTPAVRALRGSLFLAKGELQGNSEPLWRSPTTTLKGVGFNYDFSDEEGPARDLRTGQPMDPNSGLPTTPILAIDDLLVTTGMDGLFPPGLRVATVTKIDALKEGGYAYNLEATPTADNLNNLSHVFILPPLGFNPRDTAPVVGEVLPELPEL